MTTSITVKVPAGANYQAVVQKEGRETYSASNRFEPIEPAIMVLPGQETTQYIHHSFTSELRVIVTEARFAVAKDTSE